MIINGSVSAWLTSEYDTQQFLDAVKAGNSEAALHRIFGSPE